MSRLQELLHVFPSVPPFLHVSLRRAQRIVPHGDVCVSTNIPQNGSDGQDLAFSIAAAHDGSVVLAGYTEGSSRDRQMGLMDFSAVKLGPNGTEEWWWQVN